MKLTPLHLQLVIHYNVYPVPFPKSHAPAVIDYTGQLVEAGILKRVEQEPYYVATERGKAFLEMLCSTPFPVQQWIDPRTREACSE